jgi:hypothetical protein
MIVVVLEITASCRKARNGLVAEEQALVKTIYAI